MVYQKYSKSTDVPQDKTTPVIRQYLEFKKKHLDGILLFQIGNFYETYLEDSYVLSSLCNVLLTSKSAGEIGKIAMSGFPLASLNIYIKKLVEAGFKVILCEEVPYEQKDTKGVIPRRITRSFTPGMLVESEFLDGQTNNYICAIFQDNNSFGFSYCDISTGEFFVTCGEKSEIMEELAKISPSEILIPKNSVQNIDKNLKLELPEKFIITQVDNSWFDTLFVKAYNPIYKLGYFCANAIVSYANETQKDLVPKLDNIIFYNISNYLAMDEQTRKNLELTKGFKNGKKHGTLFWALDYTKTLMGKRLLKNWISQPLRTLGAIEKRQSAIYELLNSGKIDFLGELLEDCCDILRLSSKISNGTIMPRDLLTLAETLEKTGLLKDFCRGFKSQMLHSLSTTSDEIKDYKNIIERSICEEPSSRLKDGGIIKDGANPQLDYLKDQYKQTQNDMIKYYDTLKTKYNIDFKLSFSRNSYFFEVPLSKNINIPNEFKIKQKMSGSTRYVSDQLGEFEQQLLSQKSQICEMEHRIFNNIREYSKELTSQLREIGHCVAQCDVIYSLALAAKENTYTRPEIKQGLVFDIKNGRHPAAEKLREGYFPNDTSLYEDSGYFKILTGPNMSGKSTYLKQNAVIAVMAHMGSYVPASKAGISLCDKLFMRAGAKDDLINDNSTFMQEMLDVAYILKNATRKSFICIDEIGLGTAGQDAQAIARAVCEYIITRIKAKTIFATHLHSLCDVINKYPECVENLKIEFSEEKNLRKITKGVCKKSLGIETAQRAGLPAEIIENAKRLIECC